MNSDIIIGIIIIALGGAIGNYFIQKGRSKLSEKKKIDIIHSQDENKNEIKNRIDSSKNERQ